MEEEKVRIERLMQEENLNASQFAAKTGIQISTLSHILSGRNKGMSATVMKQILQSFPSISSDWLILGTGPMYRQISHSQSRDLFSNLDETDCYSTVYNSEMPKKNDQEKESNQKIKESFIENRPTLPPIVPIVEKPPRKIKKIIVYFDDNSFQEFSED